MAYILLSNNIVTGYNIHTYVQLHDILCPFKFCSSFFCGTQSVYENTKFYTMSTEKFLAIQEFYSLTPYTSVSSKESCVSEPKLQMMPWVLTLLGHYGILK